MVPGDQMVLVHLDHHYHHRVDCDCLLCHRLVNLLHHSIMIEDPQWLLLWYQYSEGFWVLSLWGFVKSELMVLLL
jgi:hypothetical protein